MHSSPPRVANHMSRHVRSVPPTATLYEVAGCLAARGIGSLVVVEGDRPAGIITERDLVREIARDPVGWAERPGAMAMTQPVHIISAEATVGEAIDTLARHHIRRLPVVGREGRLAGIITQTDLLHAAQQRLQQHLRDLQQLVHGPAEESCTAEEGHNELSDLAGHDIKNSLSVIDAARDILCEDPDEAAAVLPLLGHATTRIGNLVSTLLNLNRLESGAMPLCVTDTLWRDLCEPVLQEARILGQGKSIRFNHTGDTDAIVRCDPAVVERILFNLLDNAVNAAPPGSAIDVHVEQRSDRAFLVRVGNRGPVIPPELLPALLQKNGQETTATAIKGRGSWGFGLTFCRLAIERHGGTIRALSPYVDGQGVAFEFVLPPDVV